MAPVSSTDSVFKRQVESESVDIFDQAGRGMRVLRDEKAFALARWSRKTVHEVYSAALETGIMPYRYIRNHDSITIGDQSALFRAEVSVIGAGGLGGQVIINLARTGIGHLTVVDPDTFDESNLNRQALSSTDSVGKSKAQTAASVVHSINPAVEVKAYQLRIDHSGGEEVLKNSNVIVDALDNVQDRFTLQEIAAKLNIPLVHGAVAGYEGQVMSIFPGDIGLEAIFERKGNNIPEKDNPVSILGVPAVTPAIIATLQTMEVIKIVLKKGEPLRNRMAHMDIETLDLKKFSFS